MNQYFQQKRINQKIFFSNDQYLKILFNHSYSRPLEVFTNLVFVAKMTLCHFLSYSINFIFECFLVLDLLHLFQVYQLYLNYPQFLSLKLFEMYEDYNLICFLILLKSGSILIQMNYHFLRTFKNNYSLITVFMFVGVNESLSHLFRQMFFNLWSQFFLACSYC